VRCIFRYYEERLENSDSTFLVNSNDHLVLYNSPFFRIFLSRIRNRNIITQYICRAEVTPFAEVTTSTDDVVEVITSTIIFAEVITSTILLAEV
jgi:hypothetical protein